MFWNAASKVHHHTERHDETLKTNEKRFASCVIQSINLDSSVMFFHEEDFFHSERNQRFSAYRRVARKNTLK